MRLSDLFLTTHNTQKRQTFMPPAGFQPAIPTSVSLRTQLLDCRATGISPTKLMLLFFCSSC